MPHANEIFWPELHPGSMPPHFNDYPQLLLAEGDSWFAWAWMGVDVSPSLLTELKFDRRTATLCYAYSGHTSCDGLNWRGRFLSSRAVFSCGTPARLFSCNFRSLSFLGGTDHILALSIYFHHHPLFYPLLALPHLLYPTPTPTNTPKTIQNTPLHLLFLNNLIFPAADFRPLNRTLPIYNNPHPPHQPLHHPTPTTPPTLLKQTTTSPLLPPTPNSTTYKHPQHPTSITHTPPQPNPPTIYHKNTISHPQLTSISQPIHLLINKPTPPLYPYIPPP